MLKPKLRFPEFKDSWEEQSIGTIVTEVIEPVQTPENGYTRVGIYCHAKGTFQEEVPAEKALNVDKMFVIHKNHLIVNITFAWEHAIAITKEGDEGKLVSHRFPSYSFNQGHYYDFYKHVILDKRFKYQLGLASPGGAGRNRVLNKSQFLKIPVATTTIEEQTKIANFLNLIDSRIDNQIKIIETWEQQFETIIKKLFSQELRFKKEDSSDYSDWEYYTLGDLLDYEQPTKYIVDDDNYEGKTTYPVLTANKGFILGYTDETHGVYNKGPVIIFDDFTCDFKYVDFPFKVKSSAMKMLTCKSDLVTTEFMYALLKGIAYRPLGHQRHWISVMAPMEIAIPEQAEQKVISSCIKTYEKKIAIEKEILNDWQTLKNALMQQLLISI